MEFSVSLKLFLSPRHQNAGFKWAELQWYFKNLPAINLLFVALWLRKK